MDLQALQARILAQRQSILEEMGLLGPATIRIPSERPMPRARTRSSEKHRRAAVATVAAAARALATGKTRKQLRGNAKFLAEQGLLHNRLQIGAPLARIEGTGYFPQTLARNRTRRSSRR